MNRIMYNKPNGQVTAHEIRAIDFIVRVGAYDPDSLEALTPQRLMQLVCSSPPSQMYELHRKLVDAPNEGAMLLEALDALLASYSLARTAEAQREEIRPIVNAALAFMEFMTDDRFKALKVACQDYRRKKS